MSGEIINVTDADFEEKVLKADGPVLVDYLLRTARFLKIVHLI